MNDITIRAAEISDREIIAEFNCRLAEETESKQLDSEVIRAGVQSLLTDPTKGRYFMASQGDRIVGQIMHTWEWSDWRNGEIWWLQSVFVIPEFRQQGVFRQLYQHVHNEAQSNPNVVGIRLYVEKENHRAQETYRRMGMDIAGYSVMEHLFTRP